LPPDLSALLVPDLHVGLPPGLRRTLSPGRRFDPWPDLIANLMPLPRTNWEVPCHAR
jgi:hypothetical protein